MKCTKGRRTKDHHDEARLVTYLMQHEVFQNKVEVLQNIINNDLATVPIQESLLEAENLGEKSSLMTLLRSVYVWLQRMTSMSILRIKIRKNKALKFMSLYTTMQDVKGGKVW